MYFSVKYVTFNEQLTYFYAPQMLIEQPTILLKHNKFCSTKSMVRLMKSLFLREILSNVSQNSNDKITYNTPTLSNNKLLDHTAHLPHLGNDTYIYIDTPTSVLKNYYLGF